MLFFALSLEWYKVHKMIYGLNLNLLNIFYEKSFKLQGVDLVFNNVKPNDWYFDRDKVQFRTGFRMCTQLYTDFTRLCDCPRSLDMGSWRSGDQEAILRW